MKPSIKKLKSCAHSKLMGPTGFFARQSHMPPKLVCDHPQMKVNWTEDVCGDCQVYVNRNKPPEPEPAPTVKKKTTRRKIRNS